MLVYILGHSLSENIGEVVGWLAYRTIEFKLSHRIVRMQLPTPNHLFLFYTLVVKPFPLNIKVLTTETFPLGLHKTGLRHTKL
jgi:hypothetical protein